MVIQPIKIILLFLLFSLISSEFEIKTLGINSGGGSANYDKSFSFKMSDLTYMDLTNKFILFTIKTNSAKNQIVYFSDRNYDCKDGRLLLGMQPYDPINLIVPKDNIDNKFLCVECLEDDTSCNYSVEYKLLQNPKINPKEKYNYLLYNQGEKVEFLTSDSIYNLWVKGINMTIDIADNLLKHKSSKIKNGRIYQITGQQNTAFSFKISGETNDFITIGSTEIKNSAANELQINDLEIMGILTEENKEICFPIKRSKYITNETELMYINGLVYTKKARTYFKYSNMELPNTDKNILDGSILELSALNQMIDKSYCISYLKDTKIFNEVIFTLQISSYRNAFYNQLIYPPLIPGVIYPHYLLKDEIAVFQGLRPRTDAQEINFNMKSIKGFPDMFFHNCTTYPHCSYNNTKIFDITDPHQSNRMSVYSYYLKGNNKNITSIGTFQPLMIVQCKEGQTERERNYGYCIFETAIFTDKDRLQLKEADTFTQFLLKGEKDLYSIDFQFEENVEKVYLDVIVFSGDVNVTMEDEVSKIIAFKYFLANKIFYTFTKSYMGDSRKVIEFRVQAQKNSFYMIQYQLVRAGDESVNTNIIESGVNFVESIAVGENKANYKFVEIENHKIEGGAPFLASFYSKNCRFVISTETPNKSEYLDMIGNFGQMIIDKNNPIYYEDRYKFKIQAIDTDISVYDSKLCMVYVSGLELNDKSSYTQKTISLSEGVPHSYIFIQNYTRMGYSYHLGDRTLPVVIDLNLIDKDIFKVEILFNYANYRTLDVYRNLQLFIPTKDLMENCPEDEICTINVLITLEKFSKPRRVETTISQVNGAPTYLEKNTFKQDYIVGNYNKYYYFDIGEEERGDVTVYYKRNSGHIFGKIVSKLDVEEIKNADWRGIYQFPKNQNESTLVYDAYYQKLIIQDMNSQNCTYGCYALLTIRASNEKQEVNTTSDQDLVPYRITIIPRIKARNVTDYNKFPKVKIPVNEYIIGDIDIKKDEYGNKKESYNYYEMWLPYDSDLIYIDWQADKPQLLINVGPENPTIENADFKFPSTDQDTIIRITKEEILEALKKRGMQTPDNQTIRYFNLTLGIFTEKIDTLYSSVYAFKVFQPPTYQTKDKKEKAAIEIIHIRSDQKVLCDAAQIGACLFAVIFDEGDINNNLVLYPRPQNPNVEVKYYADFVNASQVERNNLTYILENIKTDDSAQFSSKSGKKYIYTEKVERDKCLLLYVDVDISTIIEIFSSTSNYYQITPNPNTPQIFAIQDKELQLNFEEQHDLLINIVSVSGEGYFYWQNEKIRKFHLSGEGDRLSLTAKGHSNSTKLIAQSTHYAWMNSTDKSGFVFYITHYPRNSEYNMDQVKAGRSTEFNYREAKFPLNFFTKLTSKDVTVSFNFYDFYKGNEFADFQFNGKLLKIWGTVITEEHAYRARSSQEYKPKESDSNPVYGIVDGPLGLLYLNQSEIERFKTDPNKNYSLFFSVEMLNATQTNLTGVSLEVSILGEQGREEINSVIPENVYINGKLTNNEYFGIHFLRYKLKIDRNNPYMNIEFSSSSIFVNWCVSNDEYTPENYTFPESFSEKRNGRTIYKFKIPENPEIKNYLYLIIFNIDKQTIEPELSNFVFKYMNFKDSSTFYNLEQTAIDKSTNNGKDYVVTFKPGKNYKEGEELTYYIKGVYYDTMNVDEIKDSIAISESQGIWRQLNNPLIREDGIIEIRLENVEKELSHIKVMVKLKLNALVEYLLYDIAYIHADTKPESSRKCEPIENGYIEIIYNGTAKYTMIDFEVKNRERYLQKYKLRFQDSFYIPRYLKVETKSTSSELNKVQNQIIYFTKYNKREQLAQKGYGYDNVMWLKREQFGSDVDIEVQCQNKDGICSYTLQFSGHDVILIETSTLVYNYYITNENTAMEFKIKNEIENLEATGLFLTFYATGYKPVNIDVKNCFQCEQYKFRAGTAITVDLIKRKYFELTITAQPGDFISFGSKYTLQDGRSPANTLNPNARQITGYLKRSVLNKECYLLPDDSNDKNIDTYYLSILFYNRVAKLTFSDSKFEPTEKIENIDNGHYTYVYKYQLIKERYLCVEFPSSDKYNINDIPYTIQLTEPKSQIGLLNIYTPQLNGNIYPRIIGKGSVVFFNAVPPTSNSKEQIYNMMTLEGLPQMYIYKCTKYPLCDIDIGKLDTTENIIKLNEINGMTSWVNTQPNIYNPIQPEQYIMYVKCPDLGYQNYEYCKFQTTILGNNDTVVLVEKQPFSQYILKGEPDSFLINFEFEQNIYKIYVDTLVISGDVLFTLKDAQSNKEIDSHKYYLGNKIFYSISKSNNPNTKSIRVEIFAKKNSYYVVEYKLLKTNYEQTLNEVYAGINYLIPVPKQENDNQKLLTINNVKLIANNYYLTSFKSLNCRFDIKRVKKDSYSDSYLNIRSYGTYAQDFIKDNYELQKTSHLYQISVLDRDTSDYQKGMCMLYVSGLEISKKGSSVQRELLLSQGVPQTTVFEEDLDTVRFVYPHTDKTKNILVIFDVINPAKYQVKITYNHNETELKPFTSDYVYYAPNDTLESNCRPNEICTIIAEITVVEKYNSQIPILETTIREASEVPIYLPKGVSKRNYASGDKPMFFFTDIGHEDSGYISINFERGSFEVYAKVVTKTMTTAEQNSNWRQYRFPNKGDNDDGLLYDFYNKKLSFSNIETGKCKTGCYILIYLRSTVEGSLKDGFRFFPFTISVTVNSKGDLQKTGEIVEIHPDEYVIGCLDKNKKEKYEYYQINIPYDAEGVEFDFQSDVGILLVNIGEGRPTYGKEGTHFIFNNTRGDTIYQLTSDQLKSKIQYNSIDKKNLIIGIYAEDFDSLIGTVYSFKVHFYKTLNIHKVNSDHKSLCKPELVDNEYRCLYMIKFGELDFINDVLIYANSQSRTATTYMFAKFINKEIYDKFEVDKLQNLIPKEDSEFNTKASKLDFIFATLPEIDSHLFVKVVSDEDKVIEFVSSFATFDKEFSPNPSTRQILPVKNEEHLKLNFKTQKSLLINLVSIYGEAKLYWDKEPNVKYHLRGKDDRISFALTDSYANNTLPSLVIDNKDFMGNQDEVLLRNLDVNNNVKNETPTFAFYLEYYLRSPELNLDEANIGKTTEFVYDNTDFPFYYFTKLNNLNKTVNIFFNFHDVLSANSSERQNRTRVSQELRLRASVIKQNAVYKITGNKKPEIKGSSIIGIYDPALQTGQINVPASKFSGFGVKENEKPTLYIELIKEHYKNYKNIRLELSVIQENSDIFTTEKLYQFGKIENKTVINSYRLRVDKAANFMRIQFSANNPNIKYVISEEKNSKKSANYVFNTTKDGGKDFVTFKSPNKDFIYLNVYMEQDAIPQLSNYVFKYINSKDIDKFFEYVPKDGNKLELSKPESLGRGRNKITAKFKGLYCKNNSTRKIKVTYVLRVVFGTVTKSHDPNENKNSIALCESTQSTVMVKDPKEEDITLNLQFIIPADQAIRYTQLIAQVNDGPINEYYSYGFKDDYGFSNLAKSTSSFVIAIIAISIILFVIIVILIILVFVFSARNKNLMDKVNAVSFADPDEKGSPLTGTNLLMEGKNELQ